MDNKVLDEAVEVALRAYYEDGAIVCENPALKKDMRAALLAGMKVLLGPVVGWQVKSPAAWMGWVDIPNAGVEGYRLRGEVIRTLYAPSLGEGDGR